MSKNENVQNANSAPIKIVENLSYTNKVVKGAGSCAAIAAVPYQHPKNIEGLPPQVWWRTLLDSGSDGDLLFITKEQMKNIPNQKRYAAEKWQTSNGTFKTTHVGNLEMMFPAFSKSKIFSIRPDIVIIDESGEEPMFNMILGIETLAKFGTILDLQNGTIQIDHAVVAMKPYKSFARKSNMRVEAFQTDNMYVPPSMGTFARNHLEPISTREATKRTIEILDANYEKANLPEVVKDTCGHLSSIEQKQLLLLLTKYEDLFDGTLGDFDTDPVKFNLQLGAKPYHGKPYPVPQS